MEAALRTAYWVVNKQNIPDANFLAVRGLDGIKKTIVEIKPGLKLNCVAVSGLRNARKICNEIREGNPNNYHFIEIMACPGGCINGGGQPRGINEDALKERMLALYTLDSETYKVRFSHENNSVKQLYATYLKEIGSHEAHHLLHTRYYPRLEE